MVLPVSTSIAPFPSPHFEEAQPLPVKGEDLARTADRFLAEPGPSFNLLGGSLGLLDHAERLRRRSPNASIEDAIETFVPEEHQVLGIPLNHCVHMTQAIRAPLNDWLTETLSPSASGDFKVSEAPTEWIGAEDPIPLGIRWSHCILNLWVCNPDHPTVQEVVWISPWLQGSSPSMVLRAGAEPVDIPSSLPPREGNRHTLALSEDGWLIQANYTQGDKVVSYQEGPVASWKNPMESLALPILSMVPAPSLVDRRGGAESLLTTSWKTGEVFVTHDGKSEGVPGDVPSEVRRIVSVDLTRKLGVEREPLLEELSRFADRVSLREEVVAFQDRAVRHRRRTRDHSQRHASRAA